MKPNDYLVVSLLMVAQQFPIILVWLAGLGLAFYHRRRFPRVARLALIALGMLLPVFLLGVIIDPWLALVLEEQGLSLITISLVLIIKSSIVVNINALAWILVLAAIFGWRVGPEALEQYEMARIPKHRHGCLTIYLLAMVLANFLIIQVNSVFALIEVSRSTGPELLLRQAVILLFPLLGYLNIGCALALFNWKRWGFYGVIVTGLAAFAGNLILGVHPLLAIAGLPGIIFLYSVLHIGGSNRAWLQLE